MSARAAGIVLYRGVRPFEYLLMKASYPPYHWSPPKGHHDGNETDIQAAIRETEEESGYTPGDYELDKYFKHEMSYVAHGKNKTVVYFLAKLTKDKPPRVSDEHVEFKWLPLKEACELVQHQQMVDLYQAVDANLAKDVSNETRSELDFSSIATGSKE